MRTIIYPIFLSCRDCTSDPFWKRVFENLAYGEPPRGIYFKDNTIYSVTKKKEFNYSFADKDTEVIYQDVHSLFSGLYGLKSKGDMSKKREVFEEFQKVNSTRRSEDLWSKIKRKSLRDNLIQDYVLDARRMYNLSARDMRRLYFFVSVGCVFKLFSGSDICLKGGYIKSIEGVELSDGSVRIHRRFDEPVIKKETGKTIYLYALWESYLKTLD
jgi:hypothetical protein